MDLMTLNGAKHAHSSTNSNTHPTHTSSTKKVPKTVAKDVSVHFYNTYDEKTLCYQYTGSDAVIKQL